MTKKPIHVTRRELFETAAWAFAATALPAVPVSRGATQEGACGAGRLSQVTATLSTYMSAAKDRPLPELAVERAKRHTLDTLAAMISGSELVPGHAALRFAKAYGGPQVSTVVASNLVSGPIEAALVNGRLRPVELHRANHVLANMFLNF